MKRLLIAVTILAAAVFAINGYAADAHTLTAMADPHMLGMLSMAFLGITADEQSSITKAIEASTTAFEAFKKINDERMTKIEKGLGGAGDMKEQMEKAFKDMSDAKAAIEVIEAKMKRPQFLGADGKPLQEVDENVVAHSKAFAQYITKGGNEDELKGLQAKAMSWGSSADGGYAVPKVIDSMISALAVNISPIRALSTVVQMSTTDYHKLMNVRGTASGWVGETAARTATNTPQLADIKPTMGELYAFPQATQQMLDDVFFNAEQWLADNVATEFARAEGAAFISGNGTNQPTGFLNGTPLSTADGVRAFGTIQYTPTGVAGDWAATNKGDILFTLVSQMKAAYRAGCSFVTAKAMLFEIAAFKDSGGRYIFNPISAPGVPQTLLNYPIVEAEDMPAKAANSFSLAFGNFKEGYLIADRIGTRVIRDPFSNKPYIGFYTTKRLGGIVTNSEAIKVLKFAVS